MPQEKMPWHSDRTEQSYFDRYYVLDTLSFPSPQQLLVDNFGYGVCQSKHSYCYTASINSQ
jgi:hypothetical protein